MSQENAQQLIGYGFISDTDDALQTKPGGLFGGNFGNSRLTKFAYNANVAKSGAEPREAIEIVVAVGDREYKAWVGPITKIFDSNRVEITDRTNPEYIKNYNEQMTQQNALTVHYLKSVGVSVESLQAVLTASPVQSFFDYATRIINLLPQNFDQRPLDVFLEYQFNLGTKADGSPNTMTFPTLPQNMKGGYFIVPAQPGVWTPVVAEDKSLTYVNSNGALHPFERNANFMTSHKGIQQKTGEDNSHTAPFNATQNPMTPGNGAAATGSWT